MSSTFNPDMSVDEANLSTTSTEILEIESPTPTNFVNADARGGRKEALCSVPQMNESLQDGHKDDVAGVNDTSYREDFQIFQNKMLQLLDKWCDKQDKKISKIANDFEDLKNSVKFVNEMCDELNKKTESTRQTVSQLDAKVKSFETHILHTKTLETKIESLEQQARQCNLEIGNVPDRRGENLITLLENLGTAIKHNITLNDVAAVHRVPHANSTSTHPKNIIVKFHSRIKRDNVLAAFRLAKGVTTDQLNISGEPRKVYVNEHLTLSNKKLFREAREAARKCGYRYVWVKHGTILVRENDTSPVTAIRCTSDVSKIVSKPA